jgi:hypothetical protein
MDVIATLQRTAIEWNALPTPEENSLALMNYHHNIVRPTFVQWAWVLILARREDVFGIDSGR